MSRNGETGETEGDDGGEQPPMEAARYADGSIGYPPHPLGPDGEEPVGTVDLSEHIARVVTWTTSHATPPGVREPNHVAIVEFEVGKAQDTSENQTESNDESQAVRAIGQLTEPVESGAEVRPVYVEELRDPEEGLKDPESQAWDGYRFEPV